MTDIKSPTFNIMDDRLKVINVIIDMYPELKKDKNDIINVVYGKLSKPNKQIFTKIKIDNQELYIDNTGLVLDENLVFKGLIINNIRYLFDDNIDLTKYDDLLTK
jgi:hypothetical protein